MRRALLAIVVALLFPLSIHANELIVDHHQLQMNDLLTITVSVEGEFASLDSLYVPLVNLEILGDASTSSEFAWFNGNVTRRKVFRYRARPLAPGAARVGPLVLNANGQRETLAAVDIEVQPDRSSQSNDAEVVLRELLSAGREPLFVIAEADKQSAFVGEPVTVTWWLYNAAVVQQWQIVNVPKLSDFWVEEQTRNESPERVYVGDVMVQRLPIRRAVLFPLQSGRARVDSVSVQAAVMRRTRGGPFAMFEGELSEVTFTSAAIPIDVKPIPPGPTVDAIGKLSLVCESALQRNGGPVTMRVTLSGLGNLRSATPPRFDSAVPGRLQIEGGEIAAPREENASFAMSRQWRYLLFPSRSGMLELPSLSMRIFDPSTGTRRELRCASSFVNAVAAQPAEAPLPPVTRSARPLPWPLIAAALALLLAALLVTPRILQSRALTRTVREIMHDATPAEIRARVEAHVPPTLKEASERGDAWRALRSILDAAERDRDIAEGADKEIARRIRDVLTTR